MRCGNPPPLVVWNDPRATLTRHTPAPNTRARSKTLALQRTTHRGAFVISRDWVSSLVDAIGRSKFWKSTAIFIMWDDWGGWFDPVPPVYEDYDGLGFRVPLLIVSPYAKRHYVTHVQYETSSVPRYIEDNFGLPHGKRYARE
jgi:phospholipase C